MVPINPQLGDTESYNCWLTAAREIAPSIFESRTTAIDALVSPAPAFRQVAIESFLYLWPFDEAVAKLIFKIAIGDTDLVTKSMAGITFEILHLRCKVNCDRRYIESLLTAILRDQTQAPEILDSIASYLAIMATDSDSNSSNM